MGYSPWGHRDMIERLTPFQMRAAGFLGPDQGGFIFKGRFVEAIRETLVRRDVLGIL